ncbi:MAG: hypothetical protein WBV94_13840 [Blastocatellia bacterium]
MGKRTRFEENRIFVLNEPFAPRLCPALAVEIGLNESLLFLQIEFWLAVRGQIIDDRKWVRLPTSELEENFPFLSSSTINRAIQSIFDKGLINVCMPWFQDKADKTRWFSINLDVAAKLKSISVAGEAKKPGGPTQNDLGSTQNDLTPTQNDLAPIDERARVETSEETKDRDTHTHKGAGAPVRACVGSRFSIQECRRYAESLKATGGIINPGGYATVIFRSGEADGMIEEFLNPSRAPDVNQCPDCRGMGVYYPLGIGIGAAARCKHEKLTRPAEGAS